MEPAGPPFVSRVLERQKVGKPYGITYRSRTTPRLTREMSRYLCRIMLLLVRTRGDLDFTVGAGAKTRESDRQTFGRSW